MKATRRRKTAAKGPAKKGTKTEQVIELLRRPDGATIAELTKATD